MVWVFIILILCLRICKSISLKFLVCFLFLTQTSKGQVHYKDKRIIVLGIQGPVTGIHLAGRVQSVTMWQMGSEEVPAHF